MLKINTLDMPKIYSRHTKDRHPGHAKMNARLGLFSRLPDWVRQSVIPIAKCPIVSPILSSGQATWLASLASSASRAGRLPGEGPECTRYISRRGVSSLPLTRWGSYRRLSYLESTRNPPVSQTFSYVNGIYYKLRRE